MSGGKIRDLYPTAICHECEWEGPIDQLVSTGVIDEACPVCGSDDTEWVPAFPGAGD